MRQAEPYFVQIAKQLDWFWLMKASIKISYSTVLVICIKSSSPDKISHDVAIDPLIYVTTSADRCAYVVQVRDTQLGATDQDGQGSSTHVSCIPNSLLNPVHVMST